MKTMDHPVYRDCARFMNTRGLRQLRRQLRCADKLIVNETKKHGTRLPVNVRMQMVYESEMHSQEKRRAIIAAPIYVSRDGKHLTVCTLSAE